MSRILSALVVALFLAGCSRPMPVPTPPLPVIAPPPVAEPGDGNIPPPRAVPVRSADESLAAGVAYLLKQQSEDGAWRSDIYATFKDGTALTPLAIVALQDVLDSEVENPAISAAIQKSCNFLMKFVKGGPVIDPGPDGFDYPVYTAALAIKAFSHPSAKDFVKHRDGWVKYLKDRQLTEKLDWKPDEKQYGGWGYCRVIPKKPAPNAFAPNLIESNLSATVFALDALKAASELDEMTAKTAATFVRRCQNYGKPPPGPLPPGFQHYDGGFHFIYDDPVRNKAGVANDQPQVFHSYGSTTADGLRAMALCNQAEDRERLAAARAWLTIHFRVNTHPGIYVKAHEPNREAVYYYYAASAARAYRDHKLALTIEPIWAANLSAELAKRQYKDGSWTNPVELVRENDPIVATCNAVRALATCKY